MKADQGPPNKKLLNSSHFGRDWVEWLLNHDEKNSGDRVRKVGVEYERREGIEVTGKGEEVTLGTL